MRKFVRINLSANKLKSDLVFTLFFILLTACIPANSVSQTTQPASPTSNLASKLNEQLTNTAVVPSPTTTLQTMSLTSSPTTEPTLVQTEAHLDRPTVVYTNTPLPSATHTPIPQVKITYNAVNLRRGPRVDYPIIGFLYEGDIIDVIGVYGGYNGWYNVRLSDNLTGWVGVAVVEPASAFDMATIPTAATIPATSTATSTLTPTPTSTYTPRPRSPQPQPTKSTAIPPLPPPSATPNPYP